MQNVVDSAFDMIGSNVQNMVGGAMVKPTGSRDHGRIVLPRTPMIWASIAR